MIDVETGCSENETLRDAESEDLVTGGQSLEVAAVALEGLGFLGADSRRRVARSIVEL